MTTVTREDSTRLVEALHRFLDEDMPELLPFWTFVFESNAAGDGFDVRPRAAKRATGVEDEAGLVELRLRLAARKDVQVALDRLAAGRDLSPETTCLVALRQGGGEVTVRP